LKKARKQTVDELWMQQRGGGGARNCYSKEDEERRI
jgi:hypothetical protein